MKLRVLSVSCLISMLVLGSGFHPTSAQSYEVMESAIVNGSRTPISVGLSEGQILSVGWISNFQAPDSTFCTGTLITSRIVVTARHCFENKMTGVIKTAQEIQFGVGQIENQSRAVFEIAQIYLHPNAGVDLALLVLAEDAVDRVPELEPIAWNRHCLDASNADPLLGKLVEVAGYGETEAGQRGDGRFFASVEFVSVDQRVMGVDGPHIEVDGRDIMGLCFGDSGGPVITTNIASRPVVLGVEVGGQDSCKNKDYLTRLDLYADFIEEVIASTRNQYPVGGPCRDLTFFGRCVGNVAEWCDERNSLARQDCAQDGMICQFRDTANGYYCAQQPICRDSSEVCLCLSRGDDGFLPPGPIAIRHQGACSVAFGSRDSVPPWLAALAVLALLGTHFRD